MYVQLHFSFVLCVFRDPNTIFRGNSLTSKCIDETMKLAGKHYLQVTLKPIIDEVVTVLRAVNMCFPPSKAFFAVFLN